MHNIDFKKYRRRELNKGRWYGDTVYYIRLFRSEHNEYEDNVLYFCEDGYFHTAEELLNDPLDGCFENKKEMLVLLRKNYKHLRIKDLSR